MKLRGTIGLGAVAAVLLSAGLAPGATASEAFRPELHFTPARNWMNDPNGLIWHGGHYHLFYQYNPEANVWGHMSWGHAVSRDLIHWRELPIAIPEDPQVMIFSGSVVFDAANSSGFGEPGRPPLVAIYTGASREEGGVQAQRLAYSLDGGLSWMKYGGNPVLDIGIHDFRDPKVFWHEPTRRWVMAVVRAAERKVAFYASPDLRQWDYLSSFGPAGAVDGVWECPDLFPMAVEGRPGELKWILKVDSLKSGLAPGGGGQYFVGDFDGIRFTPSERTPEGDPRPHWLDYGPDFYAAESWTDAPDGRRLMIGWMNNWRYALKIPAHPWRGTMSLPRQLTLWREEEGFAIRQSPIAELDSMAQGKPAQRLKGKGPWRLDVRLAAGAELILSSRQGDELRIGLDPAGKQLSLLRQAPVELEAAKDFAGKTSMPVGNGVFSAILDRSSIEIFAESGAKLLTAQLFPRASWSSLSLPAGGGSSVESRQLLTARR